MRGWLIGAAVLLAGCGDDHLTACGDGTACPAGRVCDEMHHGCAAPAQLTACAGAAAGAACHTAEFDGACFDGVCLVPGCGNRVVEPGEQCDDGNHVGDDGCSADCRSDEQCGNGVVDGAIGEACDDGNLASHDGCNSRCQLESPQWTIDPAILRYVPPTSATASPGCGTAPRCTRRARARPRSIAGPPPRTTRAAGASYAAVTQLS